jgi:hypothetical protein
VVPVIMYQPHPKGAERAAGEEARGILQVIDPAPVDGLDHVAWR